MRLYGSFYAFAYALLIAVIWILPFYSFEGYSHMVNSISELGAQNVPNDWIINLAIFLMGFATFTLATKAYKLRSVQLITLYFFSISFFLTGFFQLAGNEANVFHYNYTQDALHSICSMVMGFAFCLFCLLLIWALKRDKHKLHTSIVIVTIIVLSYLIFAFPNLKGLFQRILFMLAFGWLFFAIIKYPLQEKGKHILKKNTDH
ncbi:DUF998 domain-containing protein [Spongiivirga citrea]|uniref:DUF998 domain-containing protein n=1 Tax=Spongiivirga citrea TaxID=1481457 RepID=A0A6M0CMX8_9FLAO|nr:DUF998 domain-containing protein [Spongiivirga citrea]NER16837.1 DUF998 domain-containing protein [Spongiivirga citrea]